MRKLIAGIILGTALLCGTKAHAQYNREYFFWVGRSCMMNNDYQEAIRTLNTLLRFDEDAFEGYFLRGIAKYNLDDLLGAEDDFSTAIRLNPVYTQAYTYRAITRSRLGNYDDALQDFREAIELRPDLPGPYYSRGVTRLLNQQFKEAIDDFDKFIRQENKVAEIPGAQVVPTSAKENFNIEGLFRTILSLLPEGPAFYPKDTLTDKTLRFFASEIIREKILKFYDKEIPYCCEIEIESYKEEPTIDRIAATIYVARDSQKGILIGHKGEKLKRVGQTAREDMEQFLGKKVFLQLFVKVSDDWRNNERQLRRFGYEQE